MGTMIAHFSLVHYLLAKLRFVPESDNGIEFKLLCHINHGPEWNVEFSIPIQTPYWHFPNFWAYSMSDVTYQNFLI